MAMKVPTRKTLQKYGLTEQDWINLYEIQGGICPVCERKPPPPYNLVVDHEHVKGWAKMKPEDRSQYVRGLLCNRCNWQFLRRGMNVTIARNLTNYLEDYENAERINVNFGTNQGV